MKLIIEIPERYYEFCRECVINRTDTVDQMFIANGTPYEEKPQGKWINGFCNICNCSCKSDGCGHVIETNFCPNCGADMREA